MIPLYHILYLYFICIHILNIFIHVLAQVEVVITIRNLHLVPSIDHLSFIMLLEQSETFNTHFFKVCVQGLSLILGP